MKRVVSAIACAFIICVCFSSCNLLGELTGLYVDKWANLVNETGHSAEVSGNTLTYGSHTYTVSGEIDYDFDPAKFVKRATASVTFTNIPSGYTEFKAVYENLLGKSLPGTASMVPMAMEIYARNRTTGEKCFKLLCKDDATVSGIIRILKTKFPDSVEDERDNYVQRYLPAALLNGARYDNAYTPDVPYVIESGPASTKPQETKMSPYGTVYYTYLYGEGWSSNNRDVTLFLPKGESLYKVQSCSSCYTQCQDIFGGPWEGLQ